MIPPLRRSSSDEQKHRFKRNSSGTLTEKFFSEILDKTCEKEQQKDIHVHTSGYTRNALPSCIFINMREYC